MILVLLPLVQPLRRWIDHSIDNLFSREIDRFEKLAAGLDEISRSTVDLNQLLRRPRSDFERNSALKRSV